MLRIKTLIIAIAITATMATIMPNEAAADGPLRRWWRNLTGRNCCQTQAPARVPVTTNYANPYGLQPGQCMQTCQKTCTRTVVNYVPQTAYRTVYNRVPVTQYKPVTNSDPCTGCTVTCMKPCTTYTYQVQRVPYTTYRPVYRQESYKVPVTTITNGCATGNCGVNTGCDSCVSNAPAVNQNFAPTQAPTVAPDPVTSIRYEQPGSGTYTNTPADQVPSLNDLSPQSSQRPAFNQYNPDSRGRQFKASSPSPVYNQLNQPSVINYNDGKTAMRPIRKNWSYSPVRTASRSLDTSFASLPASRTTTTKSRWVEQ